VLALPETCLANFFEAITLFSRGYLLRQREVAKNSGFNEFMEDSLGFCGANPEFSATVESGGILL
jgi:hypothetical protein